MNLVVIVALTVAWTISTEVMRLTEDDDATEQEKNGCRHQHPLDIFVRIISARERITTLHCDKIDESPAINAEEYKAQHLRQWEPGRVDNYSIVPLLIQLRLRVNLRQYLVKHQK